MSFYQKLVVVIPVEVTEYKGATGTKRIPHTVQYLLTAGSVGELI